MSAPSDSVRHELQQYLESDNSRVGEVYRLTARGLNPGEIADELGVSTSGFVSNNRTMARALLEGHVPGGVTMAQAVVNFLHKVSRDPGLSTGARAYLQHQLEALGEVKEKKWTLQTHSGTRASEREKLSLPAGGAARPEGHRAGGTSLRMQVEEEIRRRTGELVRRIEDETDMRTADYRNVAASEKPLDAVMRVVRWSAEDGQSLFDWLTYNGRSDLTLEAAVIAWSQDLPLPTDLVDEARARLAEAEEKRAGKIRERKGRPRD